MMAAVKSALKSREKDAETMASGSAARQPAKKTGASDVLHHVVIAIDGPAGSGKGTLGRRLAEELEFAFLDTGALYRAVAMVMVDMNGNPDYASDIDFAIKTATKYLTPELLQRPELRREDVAAMASKVAAVPAVRDALLDFQREFAATPQDGFGGVILDGRDIGTVVCPDADIKLFVTADAEIRAKRRYAEVRAAGKNKSYDEILADMKERDTRDSTRAIAPTKPAEDAIVVDTSNWGIEETFQNTLAQIRNAMATRAAKTA